MIRSRSSRLIALLAVVVAAAWAATPAVASVTVRPGETLGAIAARLGTTPQALAALNGIRNPNLVVAGTVLRTAAGESTSATASGTAPAASGAVGTHRVRPGETLAAIAARYGTTVGAIVRANGIADPNMVVAGTALRVPGGSGGGAPAQQAAPAASAATGGYTVRSGDTLAAIAARSGTTVAALVRLNGLSNPNVLSVGAVLRVPGASAASPAAVSGPPLPYVDKATIQALIARHAARHGVSLSLARAVAWQESGFRQDVRSGVGAMGVMQLMPGTAAWVGPALLGRSIDPTSASDNIEGGMAFLAYLLRRTGSVHAALAGYNQGLASVAQNGTFKETRQYVDNIVSMTGRV